MQLAEGETATVNPRCDFYDWKSHRCCGRRATWVTAQASLKVTRSARFYCDAHRPPRAQRLAKHRAASRPSRRSRR